MPPMRIRCTKNCKPLLAAWAPNSSVEMPFGVYFEPRMPGSVRARAVRRLANCLNRARLGITLLLLMLCAGARAAAPLKIVIPYLPANASAHAQYFPSLLKLALGKTEATDGPFQVEFFAEPLSSLRQTVELKNNGVLDVIWDGSNRQRETELLPIRISLLRHLNDYRVFLIRQEDQDKFKAIRNLDELRRYSAGSGVNWPSTAVLRANGLRGETSTVYDNLFAMLAAQRFDYFPRGIYEAWSELDTHADKGLAIESQIFLHYVVPVYFFVSRDRPALADRIERGLNIALKDGSFEALFQSVPSFRRSLKEIEAHRRLVFELSPVH
jgi:hypothetical protein